jgi:hypothetical protein
MSSKFNIAVLQAKQFPGSLWNAQSRQFPGVSVAGANAEQAAFVFRKVARGSRKAKYTRK